MQFFAYNCKPMVYKVS